jgi:hypothetical protein
MPQVPIIMHPDVRRMLLTQKVFAEGALALVLYCARLVDEAANAVTDSARREAEALLGLLTPVAKSWPAEFGLAANDLAIQLHGGYGYTRDFDVEQVYRDNRLNPIHEGTHGIQAIDLVGRKILRDSGAALALLGERITGTIARPGKGNDLVNDADALNEAWTDLLDVVACLRQEPRTRRFTTLLRSCPPSAMWSWGGFGSIRRWQRPPPRTPCARSACALAGTSCRRSSQPATACVCEVAQRRSRAVCRCAVLTLQCLVARFALVEAPDE